MNAKTCFVGAGNGHRSTIGFCGSRGGGKGMGSFEI